MNNENFEERTINFRFKLALSIIMLICIFLLCFLTLNPTDALSEYLWKNYNDNAYLEISNKQGNGLYQVGFVDYPYLDEELQYYSLPYINVGFGDAIELDNGKMVPIERIYIIQKDNNEIRDLVDDKIYFTDYMVDKILNYNPSPLYGKKLYSDFIGSYVYFGGHYLQVGGVIHTGYGRNLYLVNTAQMKYLYEMAFMTKNTLDKLFTFEDLATNVSVFDNDNKEVLLNQNVKIIYDSRLVGNEILISKDLNDMITEKNYDNSKLRIYSYESLINIEHVNFNGETKDFIADEFVENTIHVSMDVRDDLYENNKGYYQEFYWDQRDVTYPSVHLRVILDKDLTDNNILVSKDMNVTGEIELRIIYAWRFPHNIRKFNIAGTIEDEDVKENTIYVSQLVYDNLIGTKLDGGVIANLRSNPEDFHKYITLLEADGMYFKTEQTNTFIKLRNFHSWWITVFILTTVIYLVILVSYIKWKIKDSIESKFSDIFKLTLTSTGGIVYTCIVIFLFIPINIIFEKMYYEYLKVDFVFIILYISLFYLLTSTIVSLYLRFKSKKVSVVYERVKK